MRNKAAMDEQVIIKKVEVKDAARIAILCEQLGYNVTIEQISQRLNKIKNNDFHIGYVATLANEYVIGWAHAYICDLIIMPTQAMILALVVDKDYRQHGIGRSLIQQIEKWASVSGCEGVMLRSNIKRKEAHLFYEKIGYTNIKQSLAFQKNLV